MEEIRFTRQRRIWRVQGDIANGDISTLNLEAYWEEVWITEEGIVINTLRSSEPVVMVISQTDPSIQQSFLSIQDQFTEMINAVNLSPN